MVLAAVATIAAAAYGAYEFPRGDDAVVVQEPAVVTDAASAAVPSTDSPFATAAVESPAGERAVPASDTAPLPLPTSGTDDPFVDLASLGRGALSDAEFEALAERLARDPALFAALIDEARSETDPVRLGRLLHLLGDVDDPAVAALATELVYSGDDELRAAGLELLKRVRPGDDGARSVVSSLLSTETEGEVLVPALTALARPGSTPAPDKAALAGQVALLTAHPDPRVRRTSIDILARWSDDATYTPELVSALSDDDPGVRRTAAFAFVGFPDQSAPVRDELFGVAGDASADEGTRRGALLALKRMSLPDDERARVATIERGLDTRPATR